MTESVRLLIWDLDETFWKGTVTEGGIEEYIQSNHDLVVELAQRGIMNSICSKNDEAAILKILDTKGLRDYFVFPSISWKPKGQRIAEIVARAQLRPESVMFVDDNPGNRAEAKAFVPQLQVEDTPFLRELLTDPRFAGKKDPDLVRLKQYKTLETRERHEKASSCSREEFLRSSDIRIYIEYDIEPHLDRAVELINRTNQLNFTKARLPQNTQDAREALAREINLWSRWAGLVRVVDKYGDYGFVGFFMTCLDRRERAAGDADLRLRHFCFSCRTLGMFVEKWVYELLGRPELSVQGEVLTDLFVPLNVDWIRQVPSSNDMGAGACAVASEIRVYGGCEAKAVGFYLNQYGETIRTWGNFRAGCFLVRINSAVLLLSNLKRRFDDAVRFTEEMRTIDVPLDLIAPDFFGGASNGTVFVFSGALDAGPRSIRYKHRIRGWEIALGPTTRHPVDLTAIDAESWVKEPDGSNLPEDQHDQFIEVANHIAANYEVVRGASRENATRMVHELVARTPVGSRFIIVLDDERMRGHDNVVKRFDFISQYNDAVRAIADEYPFATTVSFGDVIESEDQIQIGGNHYDRMVYLKLAERIVETIRAMPSREG